MGWTKNILDFVRKAAAKKAAEQSDPTSLPVGANQLPVYVDEANQLFKEAAESYMAGKPQAAIDLFDQGQKIYATNNGLVPEDILLRLPDYLRAVGRHQEAWDEYYKIMALYAGYDKLIQPMIFAKVYDKMRLFKHREKNFDLAIVYAALSYVAWSKGLCLQKRLLELDGWQLRVNIEFGLGRSYALVEPKLRHQIINLIVQVEPKLEMLDFNWFEQQCLQQLNLPSKTSE